MAPWNTRPRLVGSRRKRAADLRGGIPTRAQRSGEEMVAATLRPQPFDRLGDLDDELSRDLAPTAGGENDGDLPCRDPAVQRSLADSKDLSRAGAREGRTEPGLEFTASGRYVPSNGWHALSAAQPNDVVDEPLALRSLGHA